MTTTIDLESISEFIRTQRSLLEQKKREYGINSIGRLQSDLTKEVSSPGDRIVPSMTQDHPETPTSIPLPHTDQDTHLDQLQPLQTANNVRYFTDHFSSIPVTLSNYLIDYNCPMCIVNQYAWQLHRGSCNYSVISNVSSHRQRTLCNSSLKCYDYDQSRWRRIGATTWIWMVVGEQQPPANHRNRLRTRSTTISRAWTRRSRRFSRNGGRNTLNTWRM